MKQTSASVLALLLANVSAHKLSKLNIHHNQLVDVGVRFATGMNGDEDLAQDITMKGEKFHYGQQLAQAGPKPAQTLPLCDGSNGVVGLDCLSAWNYPKKTVGRPHTPMNDAYMAGAPRYASRVQQDDTVEAKNDTTEEDDTAPEPVLPTCVAGDAKMVPGVDCIKKKPAKMCPGNMAPTLPEGEEQTCVIWANCEQIVADGGTAEPGVNCFRPGASALLQTESHHRHHHSHHHKNRQDDTVQPTNTTTEEDDTAPEPVLPTCVAGDAKMVPGVDCIKKKPAKMCPGNMAPTLQEGEEQTCVIWANCETIVADGGTAEPGVNCFRPGASALYQSYAPGGSSLAQHRHRQDDSTETRNQTTEEDDTEAEPVLPTCVAGDTTKVPGVDCLRAVVPVPLTPVPLTPVPTPTPTPILAQHKHHHKHSHHLVQQDGGDIQTDRGSDGDEGEIIAPLPDCTGAKGEQPRIDCKPRRVIGCPNNVLPTLGENEEANCEVLPLCSSEGAGTNCFAGAQASLLQMSKEEGKGDEPFKFPAVNKAFDLPELPECTGLNGPDAGGRKVQCRQVGRYTDKNWFVQIDADQAKEEEKKDDAPNYKKLNAGTPHLPECTGMNGDRKGAGSDCRQIGRYNGPWPVTDDVQIGAISGLQNLTQLPTCDQWITTNCQPVCTRDLTTGCTEERTPEPPKRDRFEGKYTHKPGQTTIQPRILPEDGVTNNYQH